MEINDIQDILDSENQDENEIEILEEDNNNSLSMNNYDNILNKNEINNNLNYFNNNLNNFSNTNRNLNNLLENKRGINNSYNNNFNSKNITDNRLSFSQDILNTNTLYNKNYNNNYTYSNYNNNNINNINKNNFNKKDNIININKYDILNNLDRNIELVNKNLINQNKILTNISTSFKILIDVVKQNNDIDKNKNSYKKIKKNNLTKEKLIFKEEHKYYFYETDLNEKYKYTLKTIFFKKSSNQATCYYICSDSKCKGKAILECKNIELTNENYNIKENFIIKTSHNIEYNKHSYKRSDYMKKEFDNNNINSEKLKDIKYRKSYFLELVNRFPA